MPAVNYNFIIEQGSDFILTFRYLDVNGNPVNLNNKCITLQWRSSDNANKATFSNKANASYISAGWDIRTNNASGDIIFRLASSLTNQFNFNTAVYDLDISETNGSVFQNIRLATGTITIVKRNFSVLTDCPTSVDPIIVVTPTVTVTTTNAGNTPTVTLTNTITPTPGQEDLCLPEDCMNLDTYSVVYTGSGLSLPDLCHVSGSVATTDTRNIENVEFAINKLQHSSPTDLLLILEPPSGDPILLSANTKISNFNNNFSFMFSNKASSNDYLYNINNGGLCNIYDKTSTINYSSSLLNSSFDHLFGVAVTGQWNFIVKDTDPTGSGYIDSWKLIITYLPEE